MSRRERLRASAWPLVQTGAAAALAWFVASELLGHSTPFFAPVGAIISLGATAGRNLRRAVELVLGVAVGIAVADLLIRAIGTGTLQIALVVTLVTSVALLLGGSPTLISQAAVSAVLVATLEAPNDVDSIDRFVDGLVGGGTALAINSLFPVDPVARVRRSAEPVLEELAETLEDVAGALAGLDLELAERALVRARAIHEPWTEFSQTLEVGRETARFAPPRRRRLGEVERYAAAASQIDFAVRNVRVIARSAVRAAYLGEPVPAEIREALRDLARAVRVLEAGLEEGPGPGDDARAAALRASERASAALERETSVSANAIVAHIQAMAVDVLRGLGADRASARSAVAKAAGNQAGRVSGADPGR